MLNRLKKNYSFAIPSNSQDIPPSSRLTVTDIEGTRLTFDKRKLTEDEATLLDTLFNEKETDLFHGKTKLEQLLYDTLLNKQELNTSELENHLTTPFRFIYFTVKGTLGNNEQFEEAMKSLFPTSPVCLWRNKSEGFLVQVIDEHFEEENDEESIIDTITSDFFVQIILYIGSPITSMNNIQTHFNWETSVFHIVRGFSPTKRIFHEHEIVPYFLLKDIPDETIKITLEKLEPVMEDQTLIESVKVYLECNMNTTLAAKKLYMHRNSLQYRVDKFIEKTSIDIKRFPNAVAVYLMFVLLQQKREL
ncbi:MULTISPECIES: PucR family transcriptional regulator [Bacillaceae]|uniref:Helix-turn-helix domain-containing protein n=1 Tax=Evansella alkalicola TaxID=745819 RepID=A0ABS6JQA1_9BACI|nr:MULTISPECIES: helix-turn-helix domain-containing protein [Bacillaceae]MBU9720746.1 helix-turn-helix domain-containing protein [Bacillus alkalicola]